MKDFKVQLSLAIGGVHVVVPVHTEASVEIEMLDGQPVIVGCSLSLTVISKEQVL